VLALFHGAEALQHSASCGAQQLHVIDYGAGELKVPNRHSSSATRALSAQYVPASGADNAGVLSSVLGYQKIGLRRLRAADSSDGRQRTLMRGGHAEGEILAVGITHYPPLAGRDDGDGGILKRICRIRILPEKYRRVENWPEPMRAEWGDDEGLSSARRHRETLLASLAKRARRSTNFRPDFILIWVTISTNFGGRDSAVLHLRAQSFELDRRRTISGMSRGEKFHFPGNVAAAKHLAGGLIDAGFDTAYSYKPLHQSARARVHERDSVSRLRRTAFRIDRSFAINCYGRKVYCAARRFAGL